MKLIEQTSNQLILRDSPKRVWRMRLASTPFFIVGILGLCVVLIEGIFPSLFIIFCLAFGIFGVFLTAHQTVIFDKSQNQLTMINKRLLGTQKEQYTLDNLKVSVEKTSLQVKTYNSIFILQKEPIYQVRLDIPFPTKTIKISSNYSLLQNQAIEIADQINCFLNLSPSTAFSPQVSANLPSSSNPVQLNVRFWKKRFLGWVLLIGTYLILTHIDWGIFPWVQHPKMDCNLGKNSSPYCNFSPIYTLEEHPNASALAMSADGKTLISGGKDKAIKVWDLQTGILKKTLDSHSGEIYTVAIAPDGKTVVSGSGDRRIRIWDITSDQPLKTLAPHSLTVKRVEISSDGKTIISHSDNELKAWDLATGQLKTTLTLPSFRLLEINRKDKTALIQLPNDQLKVWNGINNQQNILSTLPKSLTWVSISLDGQTLVGMVNSPIQLGGKPKVLRLKIWDLPTTTLKTEGGNVSRILDTALSRTHLITSTEEGIKVWNLQTAQLEATLNSEKLQHLVVNPDGKVFAGIMTDANKQNRQIQVWKRP